MGQKVNPTSFRIGTIFSWKSRWFSDRKHYADIMLEDHKIRGFMQKRLSNAGLVQIDIERLFAKIKIVLMVSRPGVVIGKGGANLEVLKKEVDRLINIAKDKKSKLHIELKVNEVTQPELSAKLVAERIIMQLINRYPHRRAVTQALDNVMGGGAKGVKIQLGGRVGGAEISRREKYYRGSVPTQTLRANIDYYEAPAATRSGYVGVKVWINKGEVV